MVGPKYSKPTVPIAPAFKEAPPASFKEGDGWKTAQPNDQVLRGDWWSMFLDPQLDALEVQVDQANQTLRAADANYRAARAAVEYARAGLKPTITTSPGIEAVHQTIGKTSDGQLITSGPTAFTLPIDLSWEIDLWGRLRRAVTQATEQAEASGDDLENARRACMPSLRWIISSCAAPTRRRSCWTKRSKRTPALCSSPRIAMRAGPLRNRT